MIVVLEFMRVLVLGDVHLTVLRSRGSAEGVVEVRGGMRGRVPSIGGCMFMNGEADVVTPRLRIFHNI